MDRQAPARRTGASRRVGGTAAAVIAGPGARNDARARLSNAAALPLLCPTPLRMRHLGPCQCEACPLLCAEHRHRRRGRGERCVAIASSRSQDIGSAPKAAADCGMDPATPSPMTRVLRSRGPATSSGSNRTRCCPPPRWGFRRLDSGRVRCAQAGRDAHVLDHLGAQPVGGRTRRGRQVGGSWATSRPSEQARTVGRRRTWPVMLGTSQGGRNPRTRWHSFVSMHVLI